MGLRATIALRTLKSVNKIWILWQIFQVIWEPPKMQGPIAAINEYVLAIFGDRERDNILIFFYNRLHLVHCALKFWLCPPSCYLQKITHSQKKGNAKFKEYASYNFLFVRSSRKWIVEANFWYYFQGVHELQCLFSFRNLGRWVVKANSSFCNGDPSKVCKVSKTLKNT